jgi:hypothetical protein
MPGFTRPSRLRPKSVVTLMLALLGMLAGCGTVQAGLQPVGIVVAQ